MSLSQAELCKLARFTTDQLEAIGAKYQKIDDVFGWVFMDGSQGYYETSTPHHYFIIIKKSKDDEC